MLGIFYSSKMRFRSDGDQREIGPYCAHESKDLQKGITTPLEVSHDHLLITPPSHFRLQKVRGLVVGFSWLRGITTVKKYSYGNR